MKKVWKIDPHHSEIFFAVRHLKISEITGRFNDFLLSFETSGADFSTLAEVTFSASVNSINTSNLQRDIHLQSRDFFDGTKFPFLKFTGNEFIQHGQQLTGIMSASSKDYTLKGELTIKGISKSITLSGQYGGSSIDEKGDKRAAFSFKGCLSRSDFGISWQSAKMPADFVLGDQIRVFGNFQVVLQP